MDRAVPVGPELTRRALLASGGAAVAALAVGRLPAISLGEPAGASAQLTAAPLRRSAFAARVGERHTLRAASGDAVRARLVAVDDYAGGPAGPSAEDAFVLRFHASRDAPRLDQDVLSVEHPAGRHALLVSPSGTGRRGQDYTAVIDTTPRPGAPRSNHG